MKLMLAVLSSLALCTLIITGCGGGGTSASSTTSWATLGITSASSQTTLSWTKLTAKAAGTSTYNLYWSTSPGVTKKTGNKIAGVVSPYTHTGLANDVMYYYVVTEVNSNVESPESHGIATTPKAQPPPVPYGITVTPSNASVQIKIDRTGAVATTRFNLYWSTSPAMANPVRLANAFGTATTFQHSALTNGTTYYYAVAAEGLDGESQLSKTVAATPLADIQAVNYQAGAYPARIAAPNAITATAANQLVTLIWNVPAKQLPTIYDPAATPTQTPVVSAFYVYWATSFISDASKANKIRIPTGGTLKLPMTFAHNTSLANNTPYYYVITSVADTDANGNPLMTTNGTPLTFESPISSQVMVTPAAKSPAALTGLSAIAGTQSITIGWTKSTVSNVTYTVYASNTAPANPEDLITSANRLATTTTNAYTHSGLQTGITYYYAVTATSEAESAASPVVAVNLW